MDFSHTLLQVTKLGYLLLYRATPINSYLQLYLGEKIQELRFEIGMLHIDLHLIFEKSSLKNQVGWTWCFVYFKLEFCKVIIEKSRCEVFLMEQDTIENVS